MGGSMVPSIKQVLNLLQSHGKMEVDFIFVYIFQAAHIFKNGVCDPNYCWGTGSFSFTGVSSSAVVWTKPQLGLRVYVYNGSSITERCYDGNGWYGGAYS